MAKRGFVFALCIVSGIALDCSKDECLDSGMEADDAALSLLQASARAVHSAGATSTKLARPESGAGASANSARLAELTAKAAQRAGSPGMLEKNLEKTLEKKIPASSATAGIAKPTPPEQVALVNMIRHGEKCVNSGEYLLNPVGFDRAKYLAHCMSASTPSPALPFGPPTHALAGSGLDSWRPFITILPLAEKLNITLGLPCASPMGFKCIADHIEKHLRDRGTLLVADVYQFIPYVTAQLNLPIPLDDYNTWPFACPSSTKSFVEPACCAQDLNYNEGNNASFPFEPASTCFDQIWQVTFTRPGEGTPWKAKGLKKFNEGFGGNPDGPCLQGLKPF